MVRIHAGEPHRQPIDNIGSLLRPNDSANWNLFLFGCFWFESMLGQEADLSRLRAILGQAETASRGELLPRSGEDSLSLLSDSTTSCS